MAHFNPPTPGPFYPPRDNLHDQTSEQIIYINQILFIEMSGDCVEFHGVKSYQPIEILKGLDWSYHDIKQIDDKLLKVKIIMTRDTVLEFTCTDIKIFDKGSKKYYHLQ